MSRPPVVRVVLQTGGDEVAQHRAFALPSPLDQARPRGQVALVVERLWRQRRNGDSLVSEIMARLPAHVNSVEHSSPNAWRSCGHCVCSARRADEHVRRSVCFKAELGCQHLDPTAIRSLLAFSFLRARMRDYSL